MLIHPHGKLLNFNISKDWSQLLLCNIVVGQNIIVLPHQYNTISSTILKDLPSPIERLLKNHASLIIL